MKKIKNLVNEILYNLTEEDLKEYNIKLFYDVDIRIIRNVSDKKEKTSTSYINKAKGETPVKTDKIKNIQNIFNLLDYTGDLVENGKPLINELAVEIIKAYIEGGAKAIEELIQKEDKIIVDIDYGFDVEDSIGIKLNKTGGSDLVSLTMKKNGNIVQGDFSQKIFESQILSFRTRFMEKE